MKVFQKLLVLSFVSCLGAHALASDYGLDFSVVNSNPNGQWTYGIKNPSALGGALAVFPDNFSNASHIGWYDLGNLTLGTPAAFKNVSGGSINGVGNGEGGLHPGPNNEIATARWTANAAGTFHIFGSFGAGDTSAVDVYVYENTTGLLSVLGTFGDEAFDFTRTLAVGDNIDFMVGNAGSFFFDSTPLRATIEASPVPEPSALIVLLAGGLVFTARRRKR